MRRLKVAILGNHSVSYCTERELDWTFEDLGHEVLQFQENRDRTDVIGKTCIEKQIDLFIYIHTHGWTTPGSYSVDELLKALKSANIKTAGFHLDLYFGLNEADGRTDRIGRHPFWKCDYVFTADGGHQEQFAEREVNHFWLPPAVVKRGCYRGEYRKELAVDVAFVGQKNYHPEYRFRSELVDWLEKTYQHRFRRYSGDTRFGLFREDRLNDLYASVKVCVGDSCFAGSDYYWSDRVPETLGRGGFLIHPETKGLVIPGLATFPAGDLEHLKKSIDFYLEQDDLRRELSELAFAHVKENDTYTNRVEDMLDIMELA